MLDKRQLRRKLTREQQTIERRLEKAVAPNPDGPILGRANISYELSERTKGTSLFGQAHGFDQAGDHPHACRRSRVRPPCSRSAPCIAFSSKRRPSPATRRRRSPCQVATSSAPSSTPTTKLTRSAPGRRHSPERAGPSGTSSCPPSATRGRLGELVTLRLADLDLDANRLSVTGKGNKRRTVPIPPVLSPILHAYVAQVRPTLADSPFVFVNPRSHTHRAHHGSFAACAVEDLVHQAGEGAAVSERHFPHRWRDILNTTSLLRRGVDIYKVKRLLGHAKLVTTERYLHLSDDDLADAVDQAFPED
ncbi:MAG: tyrosine-type recombinase/integrase [Nitrososphaerales archaeon]